MTPDSFSDGGRWSIPSAAVERGLQMLDEGAEIIDIGAESTRPAGAVYGGGATDVPIDEEWRRLEPVLKSLRGQTDAPLSVDTRKGEIAHRALDHGADLINDISALADASLGATVAEAGCPIVLMHSRGTPADMQHHSRYDDVVAEVSAELRSAAGRARAAGIAEEHIVIDPGLGFAKDASQSLALLHGLDALVDLGYPVLVGASRKSFIGHVTGDPPDERMAGSLATVAWAAHHGAAIVRVHDVRETSRFLAVWAAVAQGGDST